MTETIEAPQAAPSPGPSPDPIDAALDAMAGYMRRLVAQQSSGELAALRRLDRRRPDAMAFVRLTLLPSVDALLTTAPDDGVHAEILERIAVMARAMAGAAENLHAGWKLGGALSDIGASERRVDALLTARGATLLDVVLRAAARLSRDGPLPYRQLGRLVLAETLDPTSAEANRFEIARDFARSQWFADRDIV